MATCWPGCYRRCRTSTLLRADSREKNGSAVYLMTRSICLPTDNARQRQKVMKQATKRANVDNHLRQWAHCRDNAQRLGRKEPQMLQRRGGDFNYRQLSPRFTSAVTESHAARGGERRAAQLPSLKATSSPGSAAQISRRPNARPAAFESAAISPQRRVRQCCASNKNDEQPFTLASHFMSMSWLVALYLANENAGYRHHGTLPT